MEKKTVFSLKWFCAFYVTFLLKRNFFFPQIPKFIVNQVRKQNTENQKKERRAMKKLLKKMAYDREKHEKQEKAANDVRKS